MSVARVYLVITQHLDFEEYPVSTRIRRGFFDRGLAERYIADHLQQRGFSAQTGRYSGGEEGAHSITEVERIEGPDHPQMIHKRAAKALRGRGPRALCGRVGPTATLWRRVTCGYCLELRKVP